MNDIEIQEARNIIAERYQKDWVFFVEHALGFWTWSKMREIIRSVQNNRKTIVISCHGSSKTFTGALITATWLNIFTTFMPDEETKCVTTAPVFMQVEKLLWSAINMMYRESRTKLNGICLNTGINIPDKKECFAIGFSTDKAQNSEGWHAWNLLFVLDEAKGIAPWMWETANAQMGNDASRILAMSTTDGVEPGSEFHKAATSPRYDEWNRIFIDCKDLPSFTGEKFRRYKWNDDLGFDFEREEKGYNDLKIQISTPLWEEERAKQWGDDSILYLTKCRGKIADDLPDQIIPLWKVMKMFENYKDPNFDDSGSVQIGGDIARMGDDSTEVYKRKGMKIIGNLTLNKKRGPEIVRDWESAGILDSKDIYAKIDDTGLGATVTDTMIDWHYDNVEPVNFQQNANDPDKYENAIAEMWYKIEEIIQDIACPYDEELLQQLTSRKSMPMDKKGRRCIESKKDYKKRTNGKSPDKADAFLLTFYQPNQSNAAGFDVSEVSLY